jgi:hypothetical protein
MVDDLVGGLAHVIHDLQHGKDREQPGDAILQPAMSCLRRWQSDRLRRTYDDLLQSARYRPACLFFLDEIYAPRDFSRRDQDFEHLYHLARRFIPEHHLELFKALFELNTLTNELDQRLLRALVEDLGMTDQLDTAMYVQAYRICDNYEERKYQIDLLVAVIHDVGVGARDPLVWPTLQVARVPASLGGWQEIYDFAMKGYQAFKTMRHPAVFSSTIEKREMRILEQIFAGAANPFADIA